jgi:long-chain acyl-CoA synthetase
VSARTEPPPQPRPATYLPLAIADGIRTSAAPTPAKVALVEGKRQLRYRDLVSRIDRVANGALHGLGLSRGDHAALLAPNCLEYVELVCGLASAGLATATINARSSSREVSAIANDARARVLFVHPSAEETVREAQLDTVERVIVIGEEYERWLAQSRAVPCGVAVEEWEPFCIPYTSGTTGAPKGVLLSHRSRAMTFFAMAVAYGCYSSQDRALAIAPLYHGGGFAFAIAPIFFGGFCEILPRFDPELVLRRLDEGGMTNAFMVPSHFQAIFALGSATLQRWRPTRLRALISNAAPLPQVTKEQIVAHFGDGLLHECYGSTESGITSSLGPDDQLRKLSCVGLPFPCTAVRLLDEEGLEVPVGEIGEVFSRSPFLFNGYWDKPDETAASMRDGWFSPGDLARRDEEGYLYIVDRKNDKIISGGVNIYPREIEEAIARHPAVRDVAVFGVPDSYWGEAVHATVVLAPDAVASEQEIVDACAGLGRYKLPKQVEFIEALPRNAAGKVLRRELRAPFWAGRERAGERTGMTVDPRGTAI